MCVEDRYASTQKHNNKKQRLRMDGSAQKVNATEMRTGATHCSSAYSQLFLLTQMANLKLDLQGNKSDYVGDQDLRQLSCKFTLCQLGLKLDMTIAVGQKKKKCSRLDR